MRPTKPIKGRGERKDKEAKLHSLSLFFKRISKAPTCS